MSGEKRAPKEVKEEGSCFSHMWPNLEIGGKVLMSGSEHQTRRGEALDVLGWSAWAPSSSFKTKKELLESTLKRGRTCKKDS